MSTSDDFGPLEAAGEVLYSLILRQTDVSVTRLLSISEAAETYSSIGHYFNVYIHVHVGLW